MPQNQSYSSDHSSYSNFLKGLPANAFRMFMGIVAWAALSTFNSINENVKESKENMKHIENTLQNVKESGIRLEDNVSRHRDEILELKQDLDKIKNVLSIPPGTYHNQQPNGKNN